jgi:hypothetical protein
VFLSTRQASRVVVLALSRRLSSVSSSLVLDSKPPAVESRPYDSGLRRRVWRPACTASDDMKHELSETNPRTAEFDRIERHLSYAARIIYPAKTDRPRTVRKTQLDRTHQTESMNTSRTSRRESRVGSSHRHACPARDRRHSRERQCSCQRVVTCATNRHTTDGGPEMKRSSRHSGRT